MKLWLLVLVGWLWCGVAAAQTQSYWYIGGDTANAWSLMDDNIVYSSNTTFQTWLARPGNIPSRIGSTSELYEVIATSYPSHLAASAPNLETVGGLTPQQSFSWRRDKGLAITYTSAPTLNGRYNVNDPVIDVLMTAALLRCTTKNFVDCSNAFPHGADTYDYPDKDLVVHTMTLTQMQAIALAIEDYVSDLYQQMLTAIKGGTPTWPSDSVIIP